MKYYAVKKGRNTGIYNTWDECKLQIHEYKGAQYKKFDTQEDAESFINPKSEKPEMKNISSFFNINNCQQEETNFINIFTDGSCYGNGKKPSYGGYGVYIVDNHEQNYMGVIEGNCTNNIAELKAILHVFKIFKNDIEKGKKNNYLYRFRILYKMFYIIWRSASCKSMEIPNTNTKSRISKGGI